MLKYAATLFPLFFALTIAQNAPINAFIFNQEPIILTPGQNYTTGFSSNPSTVSAGSQYAIWVPNNVSRVRVHWQRSPTTASCSNFYSAWLLGKYGAWPCTSTAYSLPNELCSHYNTLGNSAGEADTYILSAYSTSGLEYTWSSPASNDFIRGEWLYMASYVDSASGSACSATINVDFEYCPENTIAVEDYPNRNTKCMTYGKIIGNSHSETAVIDGVPAEKFWLLNVPANSSGIRVTVTSYDSSAYYYIYGRLFAGGEKSRYLGYASGYNTRTLWVPNPPAGEFVISVVLDDHTYLYFDISFNILTCPEGVTSDNAGNCIYPLTVIDPLSLATSPISVTVPVYDSSTNGDCNWRVYGFLVEPWTQGFFNLSLVETGGASLYGKVYIRKNAWPTYNNFDFSSSSDDSYNLTPEDFYLGKSTWYFIGFCNDNATEESTWTLSGGYSSPVVPSPSPIPSVPSSASPSASPSTIPSSMPTPSVSPSPSSSSSPLPSSDPTPSITPSSTTPSITPAVSSSPSVKPDVDSSSVRLAASAVLFLVVIIVL